MSAPVTVLLIEDSRTVRAFLREAIASRPDLMVIGEAADGEAGVALVQRLRPDVVVLDIQMPRLDGVAATERIMRERPTPILLFCGRGDEQGVRRSFDAMAAGALAVIDKPRPDDGRRPADVASDLVSRIRALAGVRPATRRGPGRGDPPPEPAPRPPESGPRLAPPRRFDMAALAASTGGPPALARLLRALPRDLSAPVLVAQHIATGFTAGMAAWFSQESPVPVEIARDGERPLPGRVYLAPDGRDLALGRGGLLDCRARPEAPIHPSADALFETVAACHGRAALGVILTGMGSDGARGLAALRARGGLTIAQDEATCVVYGMPRAAVAAGAVDEVLPLERIAARLGPLLGAGSSR